MDKQTITLAVAGAIIGAVVVGSVPAALAAPASSAMKQAQGTDIVPGNHRSLVPQFRARPSRPLAPIFFGLRLRLRFGLRIADGLRQHLTQLSLGLCGFPLGGFLPLYHQ